MRKIKVGDIVVAKKRVGEVRQLLENGRVFVYFPYVHETDQMILSGYEQHWNKSDLRVATAAEKKDFKGRKKELKSAGGGVGIRRYELIDPSVNARKFWGFEYPVNGDTKAVRTVWGRIGSAPSEKTKTFSSVAKAEAEVEKLLREKEKKGYRLAAKPSSKRASAKKASGPPEWELWVYLRNTVAPADAKKVTKTLSRFENLDWMGDGGDAEEYDVSFFGKRDVVEKAAKAIAALKIKGVRADARASDGDALMTKKPKKYHGGRKGAAKAGGRGKKCAHCGMASKGPADCPEPWEHDNFKGGCSCAWCKANAILTTREINWLAKHGWSSAQIKEMNDSPKGRKKARAFIKAGKPKRPGVETELASKSVDDARLKAYRDDVLKAGVGFKISSTLDVDELAKSISNISVGRRDITDFVKFAVTHGVFTDGRQCLLIVPQSVAKDVKNVLRMAGRGSDPK